MKDYKELLKKLEIPAKDFELYERALTHRSYLNEFKNDKSLIHNERLEFLGDAVLELIVSEHLFTNYMDHPEGDLTSFRAATVKTTTLAETSRELGYGEYLRMSKGEEATGGRDKDYLLANTFESILGAIYLDLGYEEASKFVHRVLIVRIPNIVENRLDIDAKTKFQEIAQAVKKVTPTYVVKKEEGPDHEKTFTMAVYLDDEEYGVGEGASKQKAEEAAAAEGLKKINKS
jgi:ribonuclease-3